MHAPRRGHALLRPMYTKQRIPLAVGAFPASVRFVCTAGDGHHGQARRHHSERTADESFRIPQRPVVLCPGLVFTNKLKYWGGVPKHIQGHGVAIMEASVPGTAHVHERATALRRQIDAFLARPARTRGATMTGDDRQSKIARGKVNLVAFSMGGLDARWMIQHMGGHEVVESLTTISTPHRGSALAERLLHLDYGKHLQRVGLRTDAFHCLTPQFLKEFNAMTPDHPEVCYYSYAGLKPREAFTRWGQWMHDHVHRQEGPNDGLVGVESAKWGRFLDTVPASHLELIDWPLGVRHAHRYCVIHNFYDNLLHHLAVQGH